MRVTAKVEVNIRTREVQALGADFARAFARKLGELTAEEARRNVAPGQGPGPHPHRPQSHHEDTGALMESIQVQPREQGFLKTAHVFTDLEYGLYLELGWHSRAGNFWRYPWLTPAMEMARRRAAEIARSTGRTFFSEEGRLLAGRIDFGNIPFATLEPGIAPEYEP